MSSQSSGRFTPKGCHNPLHDSWLQNLDEYSEDSHASINKLRRPRLAELQHLERICERSFPQDKRRPLKICENCFNMLHELYPSLSQKESSDLHGHNYILNAKKRLKVSDSVEDESTASLQQKGLYTKEDVLSPKFFEELSISDLEIVSRIIGDIACKRLKKNDVEKSYRDRNYLLSFDPDDYSDSFDSILRNFVQAFSDRNDQKAQTLKCLIYEHFLHLKYPNVILPLSFMKSILVYTQTNSKEAANLLGAGGPSGKYDTIHDWLKSQMSEPLSFPEGDAVAIFDNNQVIGRSWLVKVQHKTKSSTVTTICQIEYPGYNGIQFCSSFMQHNWSSNLTEIRANVRELPDSIAKIHYNYLYRSLAQYLEKVMRQQQIDNDTITDDIDTGVIRKDENQNTRICCKCGERNTKTKRNCISCKSNLKQAELQETGEDVFGTYSRMKQPSTKPHKEVRVDVILKEDGHLIRACTPQKNDPLESVPTGHREVPPQLTVSDPCFVNPNSYESCRLILRQIGYKAGIDIYGTGSRKWLFVVCDGLPFGLCQTLVKETLRCTCCSQSEESFHGLDNFVKHFTTCHPQMELTPTYQQREFDWVILRPGNGHFEMNMFKSFMSLNWEVFMGELAKIMGFCSDNARKAAKNCTDNHKTWTLIETAYEGNMKELLVPYVRHCISNNRDPTPQGFIKFATVEAVNPNYVYTTLMTLTYLQAIMNMRAGLCRGNIDLIVTAKAVFAPLFHARNHPKYRDLEMVEALQRESVPDGLLSFFNETESVILTNKPNSGEGLDFKAEVVNKDVQAWMPRGVPDGADWLRVTRNLDKLKKLGHKCKDLYGLRPRQSSDKNRDISDLVTAYRIRLRETKYLLAPLDENQQMLSVSGASLDHSLKKFQDVAIRRRQEYFDTKFDHQDNACTETPMICVTTAEREQLDNIENQPKSAICESAEELLHLITDIEYRSSLRKELTTFRAKMSKTKRDTLLCFHSKIKDIIDEQNSSRDVIQQEEP